MIFPACNAAFSGAKGESPLAIKSALIKSGHPASLGRNSCVNVVLPAPFGPATMMIFFCQACALGCFTVYLFRPPRHTGLARPAWRPWASAIFAITVAALTVNVL
jgi:hypothetical protein